MLLKPTRVVGGWAIDQARGIGGLIAVLLSFVRVTLRPRTWRRPFRQEFIRQLFDSGVATLRLVLVIALFVGVGLFLQLVRLGSEAGHTQAARDLFVSTLVAHVGPLLVGLLVAGRSGLSIIGEVAQLRRSRQIDLLEAQGIDAFAYVAVTRMLALAVSVPVLTVLFIALTLGFGHSMALLIGESRDSMIDFANSVLVMITPPMYLGVAVKTVLYGIVIGAAAFQTGFEEIPREHDVTRRVPRGFARCVLAVFVTTGVVTVLI